MILTLLFWLFVVVIATVILWRGSEWLETSSEKLSIYYELPDIVQGAILIAIGSSFPELSTAIISPLLHGEFDLGMSAIIGSAIFNILVIPACSGLVAEDPLASNRDLVYKEAQFYIISIAGLIITFAFAVIFNPVATDDDPILGKMNRTLALLPLVLYGFYLFMQYQDSMDYRPETVPDYINPLKQWGILLFSMATILVGVEMLIRAAISLGTILNTPSFFWGVTVVAAGTSVPDVFVSVRKAKKGQAVTSLSNALGSNIFDLLVCIPSGILIAGAAVVNFTIAIPLMGALTLATLILFSFMRTDMIISRRESVVLLLIYVTFILWMALEIIGGINLIPLLPS